MKSTICTESAEIEITVVDSVSLLQSVIDAVIELPTNMPSLFVDLEGIQLGRHGSVSIMSLYLYPKKRVYLIDIHRLGTEAFSTVNGEGKSLKHILESSVILKVLFDVRHDSDALFSHYNISLDGIRDVQLMEIGTRKGPKDFLAGLGRCVEKDSMISAAEKRAWTLSKVNTRRLFDPALGGRYEIFNERPIRPVIAKYCAGDVTLLPELFNTYNAKLLRPGEELERNRVLEETKERIELSQSPTFDGTSNTNVRGPRYREPIKEVSNQWVDDLDNALICELVGEEDDFDGLNNLLISELYEEEDDFNGIDEFDHWQDDGPTSCRDIINDCDHDYYYSD